MKFVNVGNVKISAGTLWCAKCDNAYNLENSIVCSDCTPPQVFIDGDPMTDTQLFDPTTGEVSESLQFTCIGGKENEV